MPKPRSAGTSQHDTPELGSSPGQFRSPSPSAAAEVVAKGEVELGVAQGSQIVPVAGAQLVGPLPGEFASITAFPAGIGAGSKSPDAAKELLKFLTGPDAAAPFKARASSRVECLTVRGHRKKETAT
jgi:ABC-type Fe3+ transport system substrate-binding protein